MKMNQTSYSAPILEVAVIFTEKGFASSTPPEYGTPDWDGGFGEEIPIP